MRLTRLIAIAASPQTNEIDDRQPFNRLSSAWRAPPHQKISCGSGQLGRPLRKSRLQRDGCTTSSCRRRAIKPHSKNQTSSPRWLIPRNVFGDETHLNLGLTFRHRLHRIQTTSPSCTGHGQRMSLKPGRRQFRKRLAALGEGDAQDVARVHQTTHAPAAATCIPEGQRAAHCPRRLERRCADQTSSRRQESLPGRTRFGQGQSTDRCGCPRRTWKPG